MCEKGASVTPSPSSLPIPSCHPPFSASQDSRHFSLQSRFTATGSPWGAADGGVGGGELRWVVGLRIQRRSCSLRTENICMTWGTECSETVLKARHTCEDKTIRFHSVNTGEGGKRQVDGSLRGKKLADSASICDFGKIQHFNPAERLVFLLLPCHLMASQLYWVFVSAMTWYHHHHGNKKKTWIQLWNGYMDKTRLAVNVAVNYY